MTAILARPSLDDLVAKIPAAPTKPEQNAEFRAAILDMGGNSPEWTAAIKRKAAIDPIWWFNTFCHTHEPKWHGDNPHIPLILYPFQAEFVTAQKRYWQEGKSYTIFKSREQGGTIIPLYNMLHEWLFTPNADFLIGSEKRDKVEGKSFGVAMFPKLVYNIKRLPPWLLPQAFVLDKPYKIDMHLLNPETGCLIKGETCNKNFGASGRAKGAHIDEAALIDQKQPGMLAAIHTAVGMVTRSTGWISSPRGDNYFRRLVESDHLEHHTWHWIDNPDWQEGRYTCEAGCKVHPNGEMPHSIRYDDACKQYDFDPLKIAQELDLDWAKSGSPMFDPDMGAKVRKLLDEKKPKIVSVSLAWKKNDEQISASDGQAYYRATRKWSVIEKLRGDGTLRVYKPPRWCKNPKCLCRGTGLHTIVIGGDSAKGLEHGDQSIGYALDITAGAAIAEYCSRFEQDIYGEHMAQLAHWYGKDSGYPRNAHCGIEWNNGETANKVLVSCGIPVHIHLSDDPNRQKNVAPKTGVMITPHNKYQLTLEYLMPAVCRPQADGYPLFLVPFPEFWIEMDAVIKYFVDQGPVNPEAPKSGGQTRKHDDRPYALRNGLIAAMARFYKIKGHINKLWVPQEPKKSEKPLREQVLIKTA